MNSDLADVDKFDTEFGEIGGGDEQSQGCTQIQGD